MPGGRGRSASSGRVVCCSGADADVQAPHGHQCTWRRLHRPCSPLHPSGESGAGQQWKVRTELSPVCLLKRCAFILKGRCTVSRRHATQ